jgi:hypothetical protein
VIFYRTAVQVAAFGAMLGQKVINGVTAARAVFQQFFSAIYAKAAKSGCPDRVLTTGTNFIMLKFIFHI